MARGSGSTRDDDLVQAERDVQERIGRLDLDFSSMAAVANVFRVASAARAHFERTVLAEAGLSFTAFTVLWVLWVWGEQESRHVATGAGITKGTLTGVVSTLEKRGLARRRPHPTDGRLVLVATTRAGDALMTELFPRFNAEEAGITAGLSVEQKHALAGALRTVLRTLEAARG